MGTCKGEFGDNEYTNDFYKDYPIVGFPKTTHYSRNDRATENFQMNILQNMSNLTSEEQVKQEQAEIVLNRKGANPEIQINIFRNETVVKRTIENAKNQNAKPISKNFLIIYIDAISRQHFRRQYPKTYAWINQYYQDKTAKREAFQFFRYHSVGGHTSPNALQFYYGASITNKLPGVEINKYFKDQGFVTGMSRNLCDSAHMDYTQKEFENLQFEPFDHENIAMFCDPNFHRLANPYGLEVGPYSSFRRCLYGRDTYEYVLEYGEKFWDTYSDRPKFLDLSFLDAHEPTAELAQYMDGDLYDFLVRMDGKGAFDDTTILFMADHGHHLNVFYFLFGFEDLMLEWKLPMMYALMPRNEADQHGSQLMANEQKLVGGWDIYNFFQTMSGANTFKEGGRNLLEKIPASRSFSEFQVDADYKCACQDQTVVGGTNSTNKNKT